MHDTFPLQVHCHGYSCSSGIFWYLIFLTIMLFAYLFNNYVVCIYIYVYVYTYIHIYIHKTLREIPLKTHALNNLSCSSKGLRTRQYCIEMGDLSWQIVWKKMNRIPGSSDSDILHYILNICHKTNFQSV